MKISWISILEFLREIPEHHFDQKIAHILEYCMKQHNPLLQCLAFEVYEKFKSSLAQNVSPKSILLFEEMGKNAAFLFLSKDFLKSSKEKQAKASCKLYLAKNDPEDIISHIEVLEKYLHGKEISHKPQLITLMRLLEQKIN